MYEKHNCQGNRTWTWESVTHWFYFSTFLGSVFEPCGVTR
jgi:hypothetical protein